MSKKIITITLIFSIFFSFINMKKTHAIGAAAATIAQTAMKKIQWAIDHAQDIQNYIKTVKIAYQTGSMVIDMAKNLENFDLATFAKNLSSVAFTEITDMVFDSLDINKGFGINVLTNGVSTVVDLDNFISKTGVNEIKKYLSFLDDPINTSPYTQEAKRSLVEFTRNIGNTEAGKVISFSLPFVAKDEICNSPDLKKVIEKGEPQNYIKPKPPVANVDIEKLCNTNLSNLKDGALAQATLIGLAKAGYGGERTRMALSDPKNAPSNIVSSALDTVIEKRDEYVDNMSEQVKSTGLFLGQSVCFDKNGKKVNYDPTLKDSDTFCHRISYTSAIKSGSSLREQISAAALGPYLGQLAKADSPSDDILGMSTEFLSKAGKAYDIMSLVSNLIGMGQSDFDSIDRGEDNVYLALANGLDQMQNISERRQALVNKNRQSTNNYLFGSDKLYDVKDLQEKLDLYSQVRTINTERLNEHAYTYLVVYFTLKYHFLEALYSLGPNYMSNNSFNFLFSLNPMKGVIKNVKSAMLNTVVTSRLLISMKSLVYETQTLIKEMAKNNYKEQQIRKLLEKLRNTEQVDIANSQNAIAQALEGTITTKDLAFLSEDWTYVPKFQDDKTDPFSYVDDEINSLKDIVKLIKKYTPTDNEIYGPFTSQNLAYLRVRAFYFFNDRLNLSDSNLRKVIKEIYGKSALSDQEKSLLVGFGVVDLSTDRNNPTPDVTKMTPNIERPARAASLLDPETSSNFSEEDYCEYQKLNICDESMIKTLEKLENMEPTTSDSGIVGLGQEIACSDPEGYINNLCENSPSDPIIKEMCKSDKIKGETLNEVKKHCEEYNEKGEVGGGNGGGNGGEVGGGMGGGYFCSDPEGYLEKFCKNSSNQVCSSIERREVAAFELIKMCK